MAQCMNCHQHLTVGNVVCGDCTLQLEQLQSQLSTKAAQLQEALILLRFAIADMGDVCSSDVCDICDSVTHCNDLDQSYCHNNNWRWQHTDRYEALNEKVEEL